LNAWGVRSLRPLLRKRSGDELHESPILKLWIEMPIGSPLLTADWMWVTHQVNGGANLLLIIFFEGEALPLVFHKDSVSANKSRYGRGRSAPWHGLAAMAAASPRPRFIREQGASADCPCPSIVRDFILSMTADATRTSPWTRTFSGFNSPRPGIGCGRTLAVVCPNPRTGHGLDLAADAYDPRLAFDKGTSATRPHQRIGVSNSRPTQCHLLLHSISTHGLV
jgi:hypothetical protein